MLDKAQATAAPTAAVSPTGRWCIIAVPDDLQDLVVVVYQPYVREQAYTTGH
jgi:hypothetical protein